MTKSAPLILDQNLIEKNPWRAPNARVRSQRFDRSILLGPLTDRKIEQYCLLGYYGRERQQAAEIRLAVKKADQVAKRDKILHIKSLLDDLGL